jgi:rod shape-determining protein MreD
MTGPRLKVPLVLLASLVAQGVVLPHVRVADVRPDLLLLVAVAAGVSGGALRGAAVGFVAGLLADLLFLETPLGLSALVFCLVGYAVGAVQAGVLRSTWWLPLATALVASAGGEALFAVAGAIMGERDLVTSRLPLIMGVVGGMNAVLAIVVVPLVRGAFVEGSPRRAYAR